MLNNEKNGLSKFRKIEQNYIEKLFKFVVTRRLIGDFEFLPIRAEEKAKFLMDNERALKMQLEYLPWQGSPLGKGLSAIGSIHHT